MQNFHEVFRKFTQSQKLNGTFAEQIFKGFYIIETHPHIHLKDYNLLLGLKITKNQCNIMGSIHGGALATIIDCATTLAILKQDKLLRKSVSVDLGLSFIAPAHDTQTLLINCECQKVGKNIAFSEAQIYNESNMKLVATGRHVKSLFNENFDL